MIYIVEGPRNTGKSYLINSLSNNYKKHKLKYIDFYNNFYPNKEISWGFSCGKDLMFLSLVENNLIDNIILDRGFLSSVIYSILDKRINEEIGNYYIEYLKNQYEKIFDNFKIIFVSGKNQNGRIKDYWDDYYKYEDEIFLYKKYINLFNNKIIINFENEFSEKSIESFNKIFI